jgi:glycosyltransferase involved in cell wall biosynthesis
VDHYRRLADDRGVGDRVTFAGEVDEAELAAAYGRADIFVLPSKKEGFGIVFLEAWKYGLPVICGDEDASPEVVRDGGLAVAPDDVDALAAAISRLLGDGDLRRRLAARGFEQMRAQYLHPHFVARLREILRDLSEAAP